MALTRGKLFSRRNLLKTATGALCLAPLLRARRLEAQAANPKRIVLVFTPDSHPPEWWPTAGGGAHGFTLNEPLAGFAGLEQHLLFPRRIDHSWTVDNHHEAGIVQLFTGQRFFDNASRYAAGPSIEQVLLANTNLRGGTPIPSVHLCAADRGGSDKRQIISYSGPGQPISSQSDPERAFRDIFKDATFNGGANQPGPAKPDAKEEARKAVSRSILELNTAELRHIQTFLGKTEKEKLEAHVTALLELQQRIVNGPIGGPSGGVGGTCQELQAGGTKQNDRDAAAIAPWAQLQTDILVNAFSCDVTRAASFTLGFSGSHHNGMFGLKAPTNNNSWHDNVAHISRNDDSLDVGGQRMTSRQAYIKFDRLFSDQVAYLARRLAETAEGDGTMLDNTLIYWGVESGTNHAHRPSDMQYLLIGGKNLGFKTGQLLSLSSTQSAHKLHTSVLHAFGHMAAGFGIEPNCGPLSGILI